MDKIAKRLDEIRSNGYELDFSGTLSKAIDIHKNMILTAGLACLVFGIVLTILWFGVMVGLSAVIGVLTAFFPGDNGTAFMAMAISTLSMSLAFALASPFVGGLFMMANKVDRGEEVYFSDAFAGYRPPYFGPLISQSMLISGVSVCITLVSQAYFPDLFFIGAAFSSIISLLTMFVVPLVVFGGLKPLAAISASPTILFRKFWLILGLVIVSAFMASVGFVALCIGILFTYPFIFVMNYAIYKQAVGIANENEIDEIGISDNL
ncbi:hypothetical protein [Flavobacterium sp.]|uniref:hypothetical protein n=1 Tax=Flavobacterium sp. TaxID=239 RepID=UPI0012179921|nr:hypothetical protein [Flavobacterium sp.]RZJ72975.1 MAG: hypothetical protein EOO49_04930 [Flavobacterium sp.]